MGYLSTFGTFTMARLGIYVSQQALQVTGNNISNINTEGYTRQKLDQTSITFGGADRYQSRFNTRLNAGVFAENASHLRDPYLDIRYRNEMTTVGEMDAKLSGLNNIASVIDEVGKGDNEAGVLEAAFNSLIEQMERLDSQGAGKDDIDTIVRSAAKSMVETFNDYANRLEVQRQNEVDSFTQNVDQVNTILERIRDLNAAIRKTEIYGGTALTQRDERDLLVDQLSEYMGINVTYDYESIGEGLEVERMRISTSGDEPHDLIYGIYGGQLSQTAVYKDDVYGDPDEEGVKPLLHSAGEAVDPAEAEQLVSDGVAEYSPYYDLTVSELRTSRGEKLVGNEAYTFGDTELSGRLQAQRELLTEKGEYAEDADLARDTNAAIKRGYPYYKAALDTLANKFAEVMNKANTLGPDSLYEKNADGSFATNTDGEFILKAEYAEYFKKNADGDYVDADGAVTTDPAKYVPAPGYESRFGGPLFSNSGLGNDPEGITAQNISISKAWADGDVRVLQSKKPDFLSRENDNLGHMIVLLTGDQTFAMGKDGSFTGTFQEMLTNNIVGSLADDQMVTQTMLNNHNTTADELYVDRDGIMGVDLNDEAMNMMQFQKAYQAACRLMTTYDGMLDKLINGTAI